MNRELIVVRAAMGAVWLGFLLGIRRCGDKHFLCRGPDRLRRPRWELVSVHGEI